MDGTVAPQFAAVADTFRRQLARYKGGAAPPSATGASSSSICGGGLA
ncbi:MAG: hypothetical protein R2695_14895 [Acidimicrobiales bacterium]